MVNGFPGIFTADGLEGCYTSFQNGNSRRRFCWTLINFKKGYLRYEGNSYDRFIGIFLDSLWNIHDDR